MTLLSSYVCGRWETGSGDRKNLHDPSTEAVLGGVHSGGIDLAAALQFARTQGGPALRALSWQQRGEILKALCNRCHARHDWPTDIETATLEDAQAFREAY